MDEDRPSLKMRGEHCLTVFVSYEFKERLTRLANRHDRTVADMVRTLLRVGIPVLEGLTEAEEEMLKEYVAFFRKFRKMRDLKEL